jgi:sRNA-binding protein
VSLPKHQYCGYHWKKFGVIYWSPLKEGNKTLEAMPARLCDECLALKERHTKKAHADRKARAQVAKAEKQAKKIEEISKMSNAIVDQVTERERHVMVRMSNSLCYNVANDGTGRTEPIF